MLPVAVVPRPRELILPSVPGVFSCGGRCISFSDAVGDFPALFAETLWGLPVVPFGGEIEIVADGEPEFDSDGFADESYELRIDSTHLLLRAPNRIGLLRGLQTLRSLRSGDALPCLTIHDSPAFRWRGVMIDTCRYFRTLEDLRRMIDEAAFLKLNIVHLGLSNDQGWRFEVKKYPRLTEVGSVRSCTLVGHERARPRRYDATPHGGFYTQDALRGLVAFAAARGITLVPEINLPGHAQAAVAAYPEFGCLGGNFSPGVRCHWGISEHVLAPSQPMLAFLKDILTELMDVFPGRYIHIGGDEVPKRQWEESRQVQQFMLENNIADETALQSFVSREIVAFLATNGRRSIGWDEILEGGALLPEATVMSWRGEAGAIAAARAGTRAVNASCEYLYIDYYQGDPASEPLSIGGDIPLEKVYRFQPVPVVLTPEEAPLILGAQAQLWGEYIATGKALEYMAFPRLAALAEKLWTPRTDCSYRDFYARLPRLVAHWRQRGIAFHSVPGVE